MSFIKENDRPGILQEAEELVYDYSPKAEDRLGEGLLVAYVDAMLSGRRGGF